MDRPAKQGDKTPSGAPQKQIPLTRGPRKPSLTRRKRNRKTGDSTGAATGSRASFGLDPALYINKELSWLEFNQRVLDEALDNRHPLLERIKFLSIVSTNLDEFFMIRVAAIKEQLLAGIVEYSPDGKAPAEQRKA